MSTEGENNTHHEEIVSIELSAPPGWKKQLCPKKGGTPRKSEIVFTAPTGEEIHSQRQLQQYLKSHPGGPPASDFDWSSGETPRRSARISEKAKAAPQTPESDPPKKRSRKSSASKKDGRDSEAIDEDQDAQKTETEKAGGDAEDVQMEEADKTQNEETSGGDEKDVEMSKVGIEEVAKEEQIENKEPVSVDSQTKEDLKTQKQESNERGADNGGEPNNDVENNQVGKVTIDGETPKADDQPKSESEKQDGVQEPVKLNEKKPEPKDNGAGHRTFEDLKAKDPVGKAVEITENGAQAVEAGI